MKEIELAFEGYWGEKDKTSIPEKSGIYCVYACFISFGGGVGLPRELIYIGESENVNDRIAKHERLNNWKERLDSGEMLCYSFAPVASVDREIAEAALIFYHQPPCNEEYTDSFPFQDTTITTSGKNDSLSLKFSVTKT